MEGKIDSMDGMNTVKSSARSAKVNYSRSFFKLRENFRF